ncbi:MAG: KAP family NTPase [Sulfuricurvum sp.]|uniref:P-loop NTPase fold protein n=1 Tax=Sulfuricurvum sp. TaxID=2025608 RepID=UPI0025D55B0E|nr:P-loop NTPase fold protein [Sulfuricurvum sp.]MCK9371703.1 KAP family NTPase [Sulfuricurvum sp.]
MAIVNQHINDFLDYYLNLNEPQYAVLLSGKWGSGKTFFVDKFIDDRKKKNNVVKISLFGLKTKEDIHKKLMFKLFGLDNHHNVKIIIKAIGFALNKFVGIKLIDMSMEWALKQEGNQNAIFIFDDLERAEIGLIELHGYINELTEIYKQKVILLADEDKLKEDENYILFKEKTIGKTFAIEQNFETAFGTFLQELKNSKDILSRNQSVIKAIFGTAGYQNLRSLRQGILDFDRLMGSFDDKFKNHSELMTEFIQIFFAFVFETKSGKLDIHTLKDMSMLRIGKMLNDNKPDEELTIIEKFFHKYNFLSDELLLSNENWINLFANGNISATDVSVDLNRSRYFFREQKEEWVMLWHYMWIEEDEFRIALKQTLLKLENNEYLKPTVILQVLGIFLELIDQKIYNYTKDQVVNDIKKYVDENIKELEGIYTLSDYELDGQYAYYGYRSDELDEFKHIKDYLLKQADNLRNEGLEEKGNLLIQHLKENKIQEFINMLSAENNQEILYRLPVFKSIIPRDFFDALLQVENKNMRDVLDALKNRYVSIFAYQKESVLEELPFWKSFIDVMDSFEVKIPYKAKDIWIKKHCHNIINKEIVQNIERIIEHKKIEAAENE